MPLEKLQNSNEARKVKKLNIHNFCFVYVNIFERTHGPYVNISKHFADQLPTPKCKRNLWRLPKPIRNYDKTIMLGTSDVWSVDKTNTKFKFFISSLKG